MSLPGISAFFHINALQSCFIDVWLTNSHFLNQSNMGSDRRQKTDFKNHYEIFYEIYTENRAEIFILSVKYLLKK